jgi:hypothetical protein
VYYFRNKLVAINTFIIKLSSFFGQIIDLRALSMIDNLYIPELIK